MLTIKRCKLLQSKTLFGGSKHFIIQETVTPTWIGMIFRIKQSVNQVEYIGRGTVWLKLPDCTDPGYAMSNYLYRLEAKNDYLSDTLNSKS